MSVYRYGRERLVVDIEAALAGSFATADLATKAGVAAGMRVLDVGSGLGGQARFLSA